MSNDRSAIAGSGREFVADHERVGDVDEQLDATVTVFVRERGSLDWVRQQEDRPMAEQQTLSRQQWAEEHGADPADLAAVRSFATENGLSVEDEDPARRTVRLSGTLVALSKAFGVPELAVFKDAVGTTYRGRRGELTVPSALAGVVVGVFGIDTRPQARAHLRMARAATASSSYTPLQVGAAYKFPPGLDGKGQTVAIIELGGGYRPEELANYFAGLGVPNPVVAAIGVNGGQNSPGGEADGEVMLDIEVIGALAPAASIVVYFAPGADDQNFIEAVSQAVHDATTKPSIVSISWGGPEDNWSQQGREQMEQVLTEAAALGVTVTVACGDNGSTDGVSEPGNQHQHVDFPASAPHALACGGTKLAAAGANIQSETVWNEEPRDGATGGGVSVKFPVPSYQAKAHVPVNVDSKRPGRGVPDVAGDADPLTGYQIRLDGSDQTIGGTSAVAPLWAALITRINQSLGKPVGFVQPQLYNAPAGVFNDILDGNNGAYFAGPGWDPCTGLGSPDGVGLLGAL
jgi:kumamolisin